eukprot:359237-Amphidinium_carterae.2
MRVELENLKTALADVIKESQNKGASLGETSWTKSPPKGLTDFIRQVDAGEAGREHDGSGTRFSPTTRLDADYHCHL